MQFINGELSRENDWENRIGQGKEIGRNMVPAGV